MRSGLSQQAGILCLVLGCHLAVLALTLVHNNEPKPEPETVTPPTIIGVLLAPPPVAQPQPEPLPEPQPKQQPTPTPKPLAKQSPKPLPKAPLSEKAVSAPTVEPAPAPVRTTKTASAKTAPAKPVVPPPSAEAQGLNNQAPIYPQLSRKKKEQGTVLLLILVQADGTVGDIKLKTSSGFARLDQAATQAVKRWQFQPALKDGKSIDFWYELPLKFRLNQN